MLLSSNHKSLNILPPAHIPQHRLPLSTHYQLLVTHGTVLRDSTSSFVLFQRVINACLFVYISHEKMAGKNHLIPWFLYFFLNFSSIFVSPRHWHLIRTFGSSGSSVLTQSYRTECDQVPIAAPCLVLAFLVKQKLLRPLLRSRLRYWSGASESSWEESQSIHSCQSHFTCFCFFRAVSSAIINITVLPYCTS
jgi:hypothetical protein